MELVLLTLKAFFLAMGNRKVLLVSSSTDYKQINSTVSKEAPTA